jgi:hypothetical protein
MTHRKTSLLLTAAISAAAMTASAVALTAAAPAFASGATVTQVSTLTVNASDPTIVDVGTINSQFASITVAATGTTVWCNNNPYPPCVSDPSGALFYGSAYDPVGGPAPWLPVGALIAKVGVNGSWVLVGASYTFSSGVVADVYVAYNDDVFYDNSGSYALTVTRVKPAS